MKQIVLNFLFNRSTLADVICKALNRARHFKVKNKGSLQIYGSFLAKNTTLRNNGYNNVVDIGRRSKIYNCDIQIIGNNNRIEIGDDCILNSCRIWVERCGNLVQIGSQTTVAAFHTNTLLSCNEGTMLKIGEDCMLSDGVRIRTSDDHVLLDDREIRINPAANVILGNHVWIGAGALIQKGVMIGANSTVGTGSVVIKTILEDGVVIVGNPGRVVHVKSNWKRYIDKK